MVWNPPCNAGDMGSIPGWGTRIPRVLGKLSLSSNYWACGPHWRDHALRRKVHHDATMIPCVATKTRGSQINKHQGKKKDSSTSASGESLLKQFCPGEKTWKTNSILERGRGVWWGRHRLSTKVHKTFNELTLQKTMASKHQTRLVQN